jgi:hypothetical protein
MKELELPAPVLHNVKTYDRQALTVTLCCGKALRVYPVSSYRVEIYQGSEREDDWGRKIPETV